MVLWKVNDDEDEDIDPDENADEVENERDNGGQVTAQDSVLYIFKL